MTQHDYNIANQNFPSFRSDINNALSSVLSNNSGGSAPGTTTAGMFWFDSANGLFKQRNSTDSGWITLYSVGRQGIVTQDGGAIFGTDGGAADVYTVNLSPTPTAYTTGMEFMLKVAHPNTGASTVNVNGLGAISIKKYVSQDLDAGDLQTGQLLKLAYDGTNMQVMSLLANNASQQEAIGVIKLFAGTTPPPTYLLCDGTLHSRVTQSALYAVIGDVFDPGDGTNTFGTPDLRGRVVLGLDNMGGTAANRITSASAGGINAVTLGGTGGLETHQLTLLEIPGHTHSLPFTMNVNQTNNAGGTSPAASMSSSNTGSAGGGQSHSNTQPWLALNYIIKAA